MASDINIRIGAKLDNLQRELKKAQSQLTRFASFAEGVGTSLSTRLSLPIIGAGTAAVASFAKFERIEKGLAALAGSAEAGAEQFQRLNAIVLDTRTTLDLRTAGLAAQRLQGAGLSAQFAEEAIKQLGIAATVSGSSIDDVGGVVRQFSQIIGKGKIEQEDLNTILDRMPAIGQVIKKEFGVTTAEGIRDTGISMQEFTERIIKAIGDSEKFQNVQGGLAKAFESFQNSIQVALKPLGESIARTLNLEENLQKLSDTITRLSQGFANLNPNLQKLIIGSAVAVAALGPLLVAMGAIAKASVFLSTGFGTIVGGFKIISSSLLSFSQRFLSFLALMNNGIARSIFLVKAMKIIKTAILGLLSPLNLLIVGFSTGFAASEKFRSIVASLFKVIKDIGIGLFGSFGIELSGFGNIVSKVLAVLAGGVSVIINFVKSNARLVQALVEAKNALFAGDFTEAGKALKEGVVDSFNIATGVVSDFKEVYQDVVDTLNNRKVESFKIPTSLPVVSQTDDIDAADVPTGERRPFREVLGVVNNIDTRSITKAVEQTTKLNRELGKTVEIAPKFQDSYGELFQRLKEGLSSLASNFATGFIDIISNIGNVIQSQRENIARLNEDLKQQKDILSDESADESAKAAAQARIELIREEIKQEKQRGNVILQTAKLAIDTTKQVINSLLAKAIAGAIAGEAQRGLPGLITAGIAVAGISALFASKVPKLAAGGIIPPGFEGDRFPAMLNSGEAVIPLKKLFDVLEGGSGKGEFILRGQDLYLAMNRAERSYNRIGG